MFRPLEDVVDDVEGADGDEAEDEEGKKEVISFCFFAGVAMVKK
ncbi:MAG: hypothetical protein QWI73_07110 [Alphaproteobacteria bacterium]|nr:hypothetical protein [Alphaproteobacteria bacterium]